MNKNSLQKPVYQTRFETKSSENATELISQAHHPVKIRPLSGVDFDMHVQAVDIAGLSLANSFSRSGLRMDFENPYDGYCLTICTNGKYVFELRERQSLEIDCNRSAMVDLNRLKHESISAESAWRRIAIPTHDMHARLTELTGAKTNGRVIFSPFVERKSEILKVLVALSDSIFEGVCGDAPLLRAPAALVSVSDAMLNLMLGALPHDHSLLLRGRVAAPSPRQVVRAIDFIHANARLPIQLKDIAEAAGVSPRSLQLSFAKFRGMSPMAYLRTVRMQGAKAEMLSCAPGTKVATVAYGWGFAHMGIFAGQFREMFGETPSAVLRRGQ